MASGLIPRGRGSTEIITQTLTVSGAADINFLHVTTLEADSATIGALTVTTINGSPVPPGGFGDVIGPAGATDNAVPRFDGTTGKLIQNSVVLIGDTGAVTGITTINGSPVGDVVGPAAATDNAVTRFDGTTGKLVQNSSVLISDAGAITGATTINGSAIPSPIGDVVGPASATDIALARYNGATGKLIQNSVVTLNNAGSLNGVLNLNGSSIPNPIGDVVGPAGATNLAVARYSGVTGKIIQNSVVVIGGAGAITGIASLNGAPVPTGTNTGDVTLAAFDGAPNANGASLAGQVLTLQPASATFPGGVSTVAQSFLGTKFFTNGIQLNAAQSVGDTITLSFYETSQPVSQPVQWSGPFATNPTTPVSWGWEKIGSRAFVDIAGIQRAAALLAPAIITSVTALPVFMRPPVARLMYIDVVNNNTVVAGTVTILTTGFIQIGVGTPSLAGTLTAANNFGILGNNGFMPWQVQYVI